MKNQYRPGTSRTIFSFLLLAAITPVQAELFTQTLNPAKDAIIGDVGPAVGSPRDGIADYISDSSLSVTLNNLLESRGIAEFTVNPINPQSIRSANLLLTPIGLSYPTGETSLALQLYSFIGDGIISLDDFYNGDLIASFDVPTGYSYREVIDLDITDSLRNMNSVNNIAFNIRRDAASAEVQGSVNFGSLEYPPAVTLKVTYSDCLDNYPQTTVTSIGGKQKKGIDANIETTFSGHITTEKGLTSGKQDRVTICRGTQLDYIATASTGTPSCTINGVTATATGSLQEGDSLSCNDLAQGGDIDTFSVKAID